jgi:hypothetical protein
MKQVEVKRAIPRSKIAPTNQLASSVSTSSNLTTPVKSYSGVPSSPPIPSPQFSSPSANSGLRGDTRRTLSIGSAQGLSSNTTTYAATAGSSAQKPSLSSNSSNQLHANNGPGGMSAQKKSPSNSISMPSPAGRAVSAPSYAAALKLGSSFEEATNQFGGITSSPSSSNSSNSLFHQQQSNSLTDFAGSLLSSSTNNHSLFLNHNTPSLSGLSSNSTPGASSNNLQSLLQTHSNNNNSNSNKDFEQAMRARAQSEPIVRLDGGFGGNDLNNPFGLNGPALTSAFLNSRHFTSSLSGFGADLGPVNSLGFGFPGLEKDKSSSVSANAANSTPSLSSLPWLSSPSSMSYDSALDGSLATSNLNLPPPMLQSSPLLSHSAAPGTNDLLGRNRANSFTLSGNSSTVTATSSGITGSSAPGLLKPNSSNSLLGFGGYPPLHGNHENQNAGLFSTPSRSSSITEGIAGSSSGTYNLPGLSDLRLDSQEFDPSAASKWSSNRL